MSAADPSLLPGTPPPVLQAVWDALSRQERAALREHLLGGTSADWLATVLTGSGWRVGATTIKTYRRALRQAGVQV